MTATTKRWKPRADTTITSWGPEESQIGEPMNRALLRFALKCGFIVLLVTTLLGCGASERSQAEVTKEVDMAALQSCIDSGDAARLSELIHGQKIANRQIQELVMHAANRRQIDIVAMLLDMGVDLVGPVEDLQTTLFHAAVLFAPREERLAVAMCFLERGADPNVLDSLARPVYYSFASDEAAMGVFMLQGADFTARDIAGRSILEEAVVEGANLSTLNLLVGAPGLHVTKPEKSRIMSIAKSRYESSPDVLEFLTRSLPD